MLVGLGAGVGHGLCTIVGCDVIVGTLPGSVLHLVSIVTMNISHIRNTAVPVTPFLTILYVTSPYHYCDKSLIVIAYYGLCTSVHLKHVSGEGLFRGEL